MLILAITVLVCQHQTESSLDANQFVRLIEELHREIRDLSLVYEGESRFVGPARLNPGDAQQVVVRYQGTLSFRNDGSALLEVYRKGVGIDALLVHEKYSLLRDRLEKLEEVPDLKRPRAVVNASRGVAGSLNMPGSPHRFLFLWFFRSLVDPQRRNFEAQGWEEVDGHHCLKIEIDKYPGLIGKVRPRFRFWIDMARGGHPLKFEDTDGAHVRLRTRDVRLDQFDLADGRKVWLPVSGVAESFRWGDEYYETPIFRETYVVVNGTTRLNQGLPDGMFSVRREGTAAKRSRLSQIGREFKAASSRRPPPPLRTDPIGVQIRLDQQLEEADHQARLVEASSAARQVWGWTTTMQVVFGLLGASLIGGVTLWKWRRQ